MQESRNRAAFTNFRTSSPRARCPTKLFQAPDGCGLPLAIPAFMNAMKMHCPKCDLFAGHHVSETDPRHFHWDESTALLFERIAGRDLSYRIHTKHCEGCGHNFEAVAMSMHYLRALIGEVKRLTPLESKLQEAQTLIDALREQLQQIADVALSIPKLNG